jgi:hypothetical protein
MDRARQRLEANRHRLVELGLKAKGNTLGRSEDGPRSWPDNLEAQSAIVAAILRHLLKGGITRSDLSVDQFRPDIRAAGYPEPAPFEDMFSDILVWLKDEGVVRFSEIIRDGQGVDHFHDVVITGHGMDLLRRKTDVLGGQTAADVIMSTKDQNASASQC